MMKTLSVSEQLKKAFSKIDNESKWTKGAYARNSLGDPEESDSVQATCFCSLGALKSIYSHWTLATFLLESEMGGSIVDFNDNFTYKEVADAWKRAIKEAERKEAQDEAQ